MRTRSGFVGVLVLVLGVACTSAPQSFRQPQSALADAWLQWQDGGRAVLRIVIDVPHSQQSLPGEPGAPDRLTVTAVLRDASGDVLESHSWPLDLSGTQPIGRQERQLSVARPGRVSLELGILLRGRVVLSGWHRQWHIDALPPRQPVCSEPVFLEIDDRDSIRLSHVFGEHDPVIVRSGVYVPADTGNAEDSVAVTWQVFAGEHPEQSGRLLLEASPDRVTPFELRLPRLAPGVHGLQLSTSPQPDGPRVTAGWQVVPQIDTWGDSLPAEAVREVVLPAGDFQRLQQAPPSQRLQLWNEALQRLMPGPPEEALTLLQQRWQEASARFVEPQRPGWRTDRGRVYIRRGAPDEIESLRDPDTQERLERWRYLESNHVYLFRDRTGAGAWDLERTNDASMR